MRKKKNNVHARRMWKHRNIPWSINFYLPEQRTMNLKHEGNKLVLERKDERIASIRRVITSGIATVFRGHIDSFLKE